MPFICLTSLNPLCSLPKQVQGAELRLDLFSSIDFPALQKAVRLSSIPLLFTLRKTSQGGGFAESEPKRLELIQKLLTLQPAFFDLEYDTDKDFLSEQINRNPKVKFILSYHNFSETPKDLEKICYDLLAVPAYGYKLAAFAFSTNDTLRLLLTGKKYPQISVVPMGKKGSFGRVLSSVIGSEFSYAYLSSHTLRSRTNLPRRAIFHLRTSKT